MFRTRRPELLPFTNLLFKSNAIFRIAIGCFVGRIPTLLLRLGTELWVGPAGSLGPVLSLIRCSTFYFDMRTIRLDVRWPGALLGMKVVSGMKLASGASRCAGVVRCCVGASDSLAILPNCGSCASFRS